MPVLPKLWLSAIFAPLFLVALTAGTVHAAPPAPDYGGRDSAPVAGADTAPNPAASAGRALEALVVVLAGVAGVVYVLKRFGLVQPGVGGKPARIAAPRFGRVPSTEDSPVSVMSSQPLPGGAMLHVVRVGPRTLLLAATPQSVTTVTEWETEAPAPTPSAMAEEFEGYLTRADPSSGIAASNARLRSLLSPKPPEDFS